MSYKKSLLIFSILFLYFLTSPNNWFLLSQSNFTMARRTLMKFLLSVRRMESREPGSRSSDHRTFLS